MIPKEWSVQQVQAAYAIATANELLDCWGFLDGEITENDTDVQEIVTFIEDIAATNGLKTHYRLTKLGKYEPCGGEK